MPDTSTLDRDLGVLRAKAQEWVTTPIAQKRELLEALRDAATEVADEWVGACCQGKGLPMHSPAAGEEWIGGAYAMIAGVTALIQTLQTIEAGKNPLDKVKARTLSGGQIALRVFPYVVQDRILLGYTGDVWLRPGVTIEQAKLGVARKLRDTNLPGEVGLVLGAGNFSSIAPLDALGKLLVDNAVVIVKLNPINAYMEPLLDRVFAPFIERGFVRITSGGADVGRYLTQHPEVDSIHLTGSAASHDAIVFGPGEEGARRKAAREPLVTKPITSELGGVSPVMIVPGRWSDSALKFHAQHVTTQRLHNSGFNCIASQVVVLSRNWPQAGRFLDYLRQAMRDAPARPAYYPGAADRQHRAVEDHPKAELLGGDDTCPRTLLTDLDPNDPNEPAFRDEYFGPVLGITALPGATPEEFLDNAVDFCNSQLYGTLGANVIATPKTIRSMGPTFDPAIARLRYGTVAINAWVAPIFAMPRGTWGAFPGHDIYNVGSGIGVVHNAFLLDANHVERSVGRGPFHPQPKPLWFINNRTSHLAGEYMTQFAAEPHLIKAMPKLTAAFTASVRG
jgi:aldehyde dehydrogenase (NAD(P)+)